jgi:hypothetical protein
MNVALFAKARAFRTGMVPGALPGLPGRASETPGVVAAAERRWTTVARRTIDDAMHAIDWTNTWKRTKP